MVMATGNLETASSTVNPKQRGYKLSESPHIEMVHPARLSLSIASPNSTTNLGPRVLTEDPREDILIQITALVGDLAQR